MSRTLVLIRHATPEKIPPLPAKHWPLSNQGRLDCQAAALELRKANITCLVSSKEPKAVETCHIISRNLGLGFKLHDNLHEHLRETVPFLPEKKFRKSVRKFFKNPDELVFGEERASETLQRFSKAVTAIVESCPEGNIGIVTHGSVISLFVCHHNQLKPFKFWRKFPLMGVCELTIPEFKFAAP